MNYSNEQHRLINRVITYIDENIHEPLPLERLAKVSTYSPFHFQRLFKEIIGETPAGYVKRLRLENAAHLLIYEQHLPITQIAQISGYSSLSAFTYSFTSYYETSPKSWREGAYLQKFPREYYESKKSKQVRINQEASNDTSQYNEFKWLDLSKVRVVELSPCLTVNRYRIGTYTKGIPCVWEELYRWSNTRNLIGKNTMMIGVPRSNPYITPPERSRYDCRIVIEDPESPVLEGEEIYQFSGGKYVFYPFEQPIDYHDRNTLIECYSELYSYWLPISGYKYLGNPIELVAINEKDGTLALSCMIQAIALAIEPK